MVRLALIGIVVGACAADGPPPSPTARQFFDRNVAPILQQGCSGNTSGCHGGTSDALAFHLDQSDVGYATIVTYAGNFDAAAPLLHAHATMPTLNHDALDVIMQWFDAERAERGL